MRNFKRGIWIAVFFILCFAVNGILNYCLYPYTYTRVDVHQLETGNFEELFVGSSHGKCGLDPQAMEEITGRKAYNVCQGGEYPMDAYFLVREAARHRKLKRVIYELDPGYWVTKPNQTGDYVGFYREMSWSKVKGGYFWGKMMDSDFRTVLFPWYLYRKEIKNIPHFIQVKQSRAYKEYDITAFCSRVQDYRKDGFISRKPAAGDKTKEDQPILWKEEDYQEDAGAYFEKLARFCKDEGIQLIAVTTPIPSRTYEKYQQAYEDGDRFFRKYMEELQVPYYNFNVEEGEGVPRDLSSFADHEGHLYFEPARTFTLAFGKKLESEHAFG